MKNLKNTAAAMTMMAVLGLGAVSANAGLLMSDKGANGCGTVKESVLTRLSGILIVGLPGLDGIIAAGRDGILMSDRDGLLMSDKGCAASKDGILISDRSGLLITD